MFSLWSIMQVKIPSENMSRRNICFIYLFTFLLEDTVYNYSLMHIYSNVWNLVLNVEYINLLYRKYFVYEVNCE